MTLYKVVHDRNNPYLTINTTIATDDRLSWKAKGIWFYAFSRKDDWQFYKADLIKRSKEGERSLRSGLKELEECGYLYRRPHYDENKKQLGGWEWIFFETPKTEEEIQKMFQKRTKRDSLEMQSSAKPPCIISNDSSISNERKTTTTDQSKSESVQNTSDEVVVSLDYGGLKISDSAKKTIESKYTPDEIELAVKRAMAWKDRESDEAALMTALKRKDEWNDSQSKKQELIYHNEKLLEKIRHLDGKQIGAAYFVVGKDYFEVSGGNSHKRFETTDKAFEEEINKTFKFAKINIE